MPASLIAGPSSHNISGRVSKVSRSDIFAATERAPWKTVPVRIITLEGSSVAFDEFTKMGFTDVREEISRTADFRGKNPDQLFREGLITRLAHLTLEDGQRRSFELPNAGAVGLFVSHLAMCSTQHDTLVLEEDGVPQDSLRHQLPAAIELAKQQREGLDVLVFGPVKTFQDMTPWVPPSKDPAPYHGFEPLGNRGFFGTQGVYYTKTGCAPAEAPQPPFDMQIDGCAPDPDAPAPSPLTSPSPHPSPSPSPHPHPHPHPHLPSPRLPGRSLQSQLAERRARQRGARHWIETGDPSIIQDQGYIELLRRTSTRRVRFRFQFSA